MKMKRYSGWEVLSRIMDILTGQQQIYPLILKVCGIAFRAGTAITALNVVNIKLIAGI